MIAAPTKIKFPRAVALAAAKEICRALEPHCARLIVAGSLRRQKMEVGDAEILYVPTFISESQSGDLFAQRRTNMADRALDALFKRGIIIKRLNALGRETWGPENKYALHFQTGVPLDFFSTRDVCWFNYLVCRTGPAELNTAIAAAAQVKGWKWHPTSIGFENLTTGEIFTVKTEFDVFDFVGMKMMLPHERRAPDDLKYQTPPGPAS